MEEDLIEEIISVSSYKNKIEKVPPLRFVPWNSWVFDFCEEKRKKKGKKKDLWLKKKKCEFYLSKREHFTGNMKDFLKKIINVHRTKKWDF